MQNNESVMRTGNINLSTQMNVRRTTQSRICNPGTLDIQESPHLIKQGSEQWKELRKKSHTTGNTAYNALGFRGFSKVKEHFNEFVYKRPPKPFPQDVQLLLQHGVKLMRLHL